jgi:hypothetical protein
MNNYSHQLNRRGWFQVFFLCALVFGGLFGIHEIVVRVAGHNTSVLDDADLWSMERQRADSLDSSDIVLLGASRMQTNVDVPVLGEFMQARVVQLAQSGLGTSLPVFRDIVQLTDFNGIIVCDENEFTLVSDTEKQAVAVAHFHNNWTLNRRLNKHIGAYLQTKFVSLNPNSSAVRLWGNLLIEAELPEAFHVKTTYRRQLLSDFSSPAVVERVRTLLANERVQGPLDSGAYGSAGPAIPRDVWKHKIVKAWMPLIKKFTSRGGRVVFVRFPASQEVNAREVAEYPVEDYWRPLMTDMGVHEIHFYDHTELSQFLFPDDSHIDFRDARDFTERLANLLNETLQKRKQP